jgi:hypothetical protein
MIYDGIPSDGIEQYLRARAWLTDAAGLLRLSEDDPASELVSSMTGSGAIVVTDGKISAAALHTAVDQRSLKIPYLKSWTRHPCPVLLLRGGHCSTRRRLNGHQNECLPRQDRGRWLPRSPEITLTPCSHCA